MAQPPPGTTTQPPGPILPARRPGRPSRRGRTALLAIFCTAALVLTLWLRCSAPVIPPFESAPGALSPSLTEARTRTEALLTRYQLIDAERRRFRLPIDRAMAILVDNPELLLPTAPAATASAPASMPASAPAIDAAPRSPASAQGSPAAP